jgi:hypothetical protein
VWHGYISNRRNADNCGGVNNNDASDDHDIDYDVAADVRDTLDEAMKELE